MSQILALSVLIGGKGCLFRAIQVPSAYRYLKILKYARIFCQGTRSRQDPDTIRFGPCLFCFHGVGPTI